MILKHIEAENILKYRRLKLTDLPAHGQIGVSGRNEAGKTAIGETICLGLFGRTFSLGPGDMAKVIRWGEYQGRVRLVFLGRDNREYTIVREIDNTGAHAARLYAADEPEPIAEGVDEVGEAVRELGGFTFQSFIDSFYLAQREMEVPHGKSATVKALIGVDKLEKVAADLRADLSATAGTIRALEGEVRRQEQGIAEIDMDRAHLGRLMAECDAEAGAAAAAEAEGTALAARAEAIGKAAGAFVAASHAFVESTIRTNYGQWRDRRQGMATSLSAVATAAEAPEADVGAPAGPGPWFGATAALKSFDNGLAEYEKVRHLAGLYRRRLADLLDDEPDAITDFGTSLPADESEARFAHRRAAAEAGVDRFARRRRPLLAASVILGELACLAWVGWCVLLAAPESAVGAWLRGLISAGGAAPPPWLALAAAAVSAVTILSSALYVRATRRLRQGERELEEIEAEAEIARLEMGMIEEIEDAPLPDAVHALRNARNDLLSSAVVSFVEGEGAVLVRPDALGAKLAELREGTGKAHGVLKESQRRVAERAAELTRKAGDLREVVALLEEDIARERERWEQVQALERTAAGLQARIEDLRKDIAVRKLGCELIEGACRRIYGRFHRELRRFVSRILPHLTEDRYEQLEVDDDLRVRVFCKEKNDFVGLAEISNGTHRQLMLCVRLALSQALIASSSKAAQFIFFDEPFAFFDEQRMAKAIDVLGRISPQIKQVWLASQKFDRHASFDLTIECDVDGDCLEASGDGAEPRGRSCYRAPEPDAAPMA